MNNGGHKPVGTLLTIGLLLGITASAQRAPEEKLSALRNEVLYKVVHGWPILPEGYVLGQVSGVGVDSHNHVFIFHRADHSWITEETGRLITAATILCFEGESGKKLIRSWGGGIFRIPHGLRVDRWDNIWVTDIGLHQVMKFDHQGSLLMKLGEAGVPGTDHIHFDRPTDVAVAPDGSFFVADGYGNSRVAKFSSKGEFLLEWGRHGRGPGEFDVPHGIALDSQGRVYVADRSNARIQVFTPDGRFLYQWKGAELGRPWSLAIAPDDYIYVVDGGDMKPSPPDRGRILKLNVKGEILEKWASFGNYDGQLYWGHDIAVGRDGDVYVGDVYHGMRIQKFTKQRPSQQ